jgi:hypothetical protein
LDDSHCLYVDSKAGVEMAASISLGRSQPISAEEFGCFFFGTHFCKDLENLFRQFLAICP